MTIVRLALPVPMMRFFDYSVDSSIKADQLQVGLRVKAPFGSRQLVGFIVECDVQPDIAPAKLRPISELLDSQCVFPKPLWQLLKFAAHYYHHPLGEVLAHAMPAALRQGGQPMYERVRQYQLTEAGQAVDVNSLKRAVQQQKVLAALAHGPLTHADLRAAEVSSSALKALQAKEWLVVNEQSSKGDGWAFTEGEAGHRLNEQQAVAVAAMHQAIDSAQAHVWLLEGVTGSGKTEVYLQVIEKVLQAGRQVLVLVPEIGLTPQTIRRFKARFEVPIVALHSGLTDNERLQGWLAGRDNQAAIIIGTRSAIFTPCSALGLIILDEEHDSSFKQQDGFRYNARDLAVKRAHDAGVNLILGSATPSLETLSNALQGRYRHLRLLHRAGDAQLAKHVLVDLKQERIRHGLSDSLVRALEKHLKAGNQALLFINRRGFASALLCHECGWIGECGRCHRPFTVHQQAQKLQCHHCGAENRIPRQCLSCGSTQLITQGLGTEQLETVLQDILPDYPVLRIDRDSTRRKGELAKHLEAATQGDYPLLVGTQMLAKGHHFPNVTLVALLDVDGALYSSDFRAAERLAQLFTQVAGRAGRASKPGVVVLQTHHPEHPLLQDLVNNGYHDFARSALQERQVALLPPLASMALLRAEATQEADAERLLQAMAQQLQGAQGVQVIGPMPAPMPRRAGRFRFQLLLHAAERRALHSLLQQRRGALEALPETRKARWSLDIDPQDFT